MSGPLNYSTTVSTDRTSAECLGILARSGATAIAFTYVNRKPTGIAFGLDTPHGLRSFDLPVNVDGVYKCLTEANRKREIQPRFASREQAERVAWRILKDWLEAQLAIIDAQMVSLDQVMLPYLRVDDTHTLYEAYRERESFGVLERGGAA